MILAQWSSLPNYVYFILFRVLLARIPAPFHELVCRIPRGGRYCKQDVWVLRGTTGSDIGLAASPYFFRKLLNNRKYWLSKYEYGLDDASGVGSTAVLKKLNSKCLGFHSNRSQNFKVKVKKKKKSRNVVCDGTVCSTLHTIDENRIFISWSIRITNHEVHRLLSHWWDTTTQRERWEYGTVNLLKTNVICFI